jgi:hypothetical protein
MGVVISADRNVMQNEAEKKFMYRDTTKVEPEM